MKKVAAVALKILKWLAYTLLVIILLFLLVRGIGKSTNSQTPEGGINESMYVEINGTKQWINIYGEDVKNPVLLYLHGGPGSTTSPIDYAFTRKWADVYTVVTWDQRNCGKSYDESQNDTELTYNLMMSDGLAMTKFLISHLGQEKITLLGHSWGSYLGANLAYKYPHYYDAYIGTGQMVDLYENEVAFKAAATEWVGDDAEGLKQLALLDPENLSKTHFETRNQLMETYGYGMMVDGTDYNIPLTVIFNPNYSLIDWFKLLKSDGTVYMNFLLSDEFKKFSLLDKKDYEVPYYNINGDKDYQTNYIQAQAYFSKLNAPYKKMYMMEDTTHGLLESKSGPFSDILHEIAKEQELLK